MGRIAEILAGLFGASYRSTILGWIAIVTGVGTLLTVGGTFLKAAFDGDPATVPDWESVGIAWVALLTGIKGILQRDNKVTSESAGAK